MTSLKQIATNRLNAQKSTGPRTAGGKQRSRQNAFRHGLTAETVIRALENASDYQALEESIVADYQPCSGTERELVCRLASVLWRLRRSTSIETGLFQIEADFMRKRSDTEHRILPVPEWADELDLVSAGKSHAVEPSSPDLVSEHSSASSQALADCFLKVSRLGYGAFYLLSRYESALWRQAAQLLFILQSTPRRTRRPTGTTIRPPQRTPRQADQASVVRVLCPPKRRR